MFFYQVKLRFMTHVESHLKKLKDGVHYVCPAATDSGDGVQATCHHATSMSKEALREHLVQDHGMIFSFAKPKKMPSRAKGAGKQEDEEEELELEEREDDEDEDREDRIQSPPREKAKTRKMATKKTKRRPLQGKDVNRMLGQW